MNSKEEELENSVYLSNQGCRNHYFNGKCPCPEGRCWYNEQISRRKKGKKALSVEAWWKHIELE